MIFPFVAVKTTSNVPPLVGTALISVKISAFLISISANSLTISPLAFTSNACAADNANV